MNEYRNIDSSSNLKKTDSDKEPIDGEKFKKALRVDASEETSKREKRNRPQKAEEEDDPDETSASIPVPQGLFKEYMGEKDQKPSALDGGDGSKVNFVLDGDSPPLQNQPTQNFSSDNPTSNITITSPPPSLPIGGETEIDTSADQTPPSEEEFESDTFTNAPFPTFSEEDNKIAPPENSNTEQTPPAAPVKESSKTPTKTKQPSLKKTDEKQPPNIKTQPLKSEQIKTTVPKIKEEKEKTTPDLTPKDKTEAKLVQSSGQSDQKHEGDKNKDPTSEELTAVSSVPLISPTGIAIPPLSPFSNMPNDVFQLFEKMVGLMQITKDSGKSTTVVTLNMPNSIFNKCELVLDHYDTAPHAYNAQLFGSPEAIAKFADNMKNLNNAINQSKLPFSINLLPPKLSKAYSGRVERKDSDKEKDTREE